jgi:hypothetical protein
VNDDPIHQILKAKKGYWKDAGIEILELVIVLIRGDKEAGHQLEKSAMEAGVRLLWSTDVEELLFRSACRFISDPERQISSTEPSIGASKAQNTQ